VVALAWVVMVFALSNYLAHESGLLAVTIMGVWLANTRGVDMSEVLSFKESLSILIISMLFIVLGARINVADILATGWNGVIVLMVVLLPLRFRRYLRCVCRNRVIPRLGNGCLIPFSLSS